MKHLQESLLFFFLLFLIIVAIGSLFTQAFTSEGAEQLREEAITSCLGGPDAGVSQYQVKQCYQNNPIENFQIGGLGWAAIILVVALLLLVVGVLLLSSDAFENFLFPPSPEEKEKGKKNKEEIKQIKEELHNYLKKHDGKISHKSFYTKLDKLCRAYNRRLEDPDWEIESTEELHNFHDLINIGLKHIEDVYPDDPKKIQKKRELYEY